MNERACFFIVAMGEKKLNYSSSSMSVFTLGSTDKEEPLLQQNHWLPPNQGEFHLQ